MTSTAPIWAPPAVGTTRVVSIPAVVVLPAPFGPSSPKISPASTLRSRPSTALKSVPGYCLVSPAVRMMGAPASPFLLGIAMEESPSMDLGLRDRACIVTGASGGVGRAVAASLASEGASLLLVGRRADVLADVARACQGRGEPLVLDVTAVDAGERAGRACLERSGRGDVLAKRAG